MGRDHAAHPQALPDVSQQIHDVLSSYTTLEKSHYSSILRAGAHSLASILGRHCLAADETEANDV